MTSQVENLRQTYDRTYDNFMINRKIFFVIWPQALKLLNDNIFVPLFHGFSSIRTAVAPSLSLDQRHGTSSKTICMSRTCKLTVFVVQ